jgi:signal transduction histidine kinase
MRSIGVKLWMVLISLVVFMLLLLWLFQIVFLENFYTSARISEVKSTVSDIIDSNSYESTSDLYDSLNRVAFDNNISIEVINGNLELLYVSSQGAKSIPPMMRNMDRQNLLLSVLKGVEEQLMLTHPRFNTKFMLIGLPYRVNSSLDGAIVMTIPIAPVEDTATILKKQFFIISIVLLIAAILISYFISRSLTKPVLQIKKVAQEITVGNYQREIQIRSNDELGALAVTINNMSRELGKVEKLRKELIANVSHELRTPLSLIKGYAETIKDVTGEVKEKRDNGLNIIIEETDRLSNIVNDILNLSVLQTDNYELKENEFSLNELVDRVYKRFSLLKKEKKMSFEIEMDEDIIVAADPKRIEQVFFNIVSNAINYSNEEGVVRTKAIRDNEKATIYISDSGIGIKKENLDNIWNRFYKEEREEDKSLKSSGLGLSIVKSILEAHESTYGVQSIEGKGSTFWFTLKIKSDTKDL